MSDIIVIIDESSSMDVMGNEPKDAANTFINEQKNCSGDTKISLYTFNDKVKCVIDEKPIKDVGLFTEYSPCGMTALNDAIGTAINKKLSSGRSKNVICLIITDGLENASVECHNISLMISKAERQHQWKFIYIGANHDVFAVGKGLGINGAMCAAYNQTATGAGGLTSLTRAVSSQVSQYRSGESPQINIRQYSLPVPDIPYSPLVAPQQTVQDVFPLQDIPHIAPFSPVSLPSAPRITRCVAGSSL